MGARKLLTDEQKNHAVWLAISGDDPRPYLTECGTKNANAAWSQIRMAVKENDPDTFAKLPRVIGHKKRPKTVTFNGKEYERAPAIETPEGTLAGALQGMQDATNEFFGKCKDMGLKVDDKPIQLPGAPAVMTLPVCAVRSRVDNGMKYKVDKDGLMVLTFDGGFFRFALEEWKSFSEEIITALEQLGVEK